MIATNPIKTDELTPAQRARLYAAALLLIKLLENPNCDCALPIQVSDLEAVAETAIANSTPPAKPPTG